MFNILTFIVSSLDIVSVKPFGLINYNKKAGIQLDIRW